MGREVLYSRRESAHSMANVNRWKRGIFALVKKTGETGGTGMLLGKVLGDMD